MAQVVNDRDVLIMATTPRFTAATDQGMFVTPSTAIFKMSPNGATAAPSQFVFKANLLNITGNVSWSYTGVLSPVINGNTLILDYASFSSVSATITASITVDGQQYSATATVTRLADGSNGLKGDRGSTSLSAPTGSSTWIDSEAVAAIQSYGFAPVMVRDAVTLYNTATKFYERRYWSGAVWTPYAERIPGNLLVDGSVAAAALAADSVKASNIVVSSNPDNIIPDPKFRDLAWWGRTGFAVNDYSGSTYWKTGSALTIDTTHGAKSETATKAFPMTPGATYYVEFQIFLSADFAGSFSVFWLVPSVQWHSMGGPSTGNLWPDGLPEMFNSNSIKGAQTFSATYTVPDNGSNNFSQIQIKSICTAGACQIGGISITRVSDSVLIKDGAITAQKLSVQQLSAVAAYIGTFRSASVGNDHILIQDGTIAGVRANNNYFFKIAVT
jgi:hypothetical protein